MLRDHGLAPFTPHNSWQARASSYDIEGTSRVFSVVLPACPSANTTEHFTLEPTETRHRAKMTPFARDQQQSAMSPFVHSSDTGMSEERTVSSDSLASTKVLGIPELLQIILHEVPVEHLTKLRPVARLWNNIISEINHIDPVSIGHGDANCTCLRKDVCPDVPHYTGRFAIRGNPAFAYTHIYRTTTKDHNGEEIIPMTQRHYRGLKLKSWDDIAELDESADHFITDPPVTVLALGNSWFGYTRVKGMLRVPSGIRVSDLRDVFVKMFDAEGYRARSGVGGPSAWFACTSEIVRTSSDTGEGEDEGDGDDEDDVGMGLATLFLDT